MVVILPLLTASRNDADSHVPDCHTRVSWWTTLYGVTQVLLCAKSRLPKNRDKQVWILLVYLGRIRGEKAARSYLMRRARVVAPSHRALDSHSRPVRRKRLLEERNELRHGNLALQCFDRVSGRHDDWHVDKIGAHFGGDVRASV
jgi:hypothetical protein